MRETLIINSQFEHVPMLHYVQHMISNLEWILERDAQFLDLKDQLSILVNFLLSTEVTAH
jgi:hypothetical protein